MSATTDPGSTKTVKLATRGTTNRNDRGSSADRRRRREWLVETYRASVDVCWPYVDRSDVPVGWFDVMIETDLGEGEKACRCYRCGTLLTVETVTVDRIIPGCKGGTYRRNNIRPACAPCNSETGARLGHANKAAKKLVRA